jgi:hypothetical protein
MDPPVNDRKRRRESQTQRQTRRRLNPLFRRWNMDGVPPEHHIHIRQNIRFTMDRPPVEENVKIKPIVLLAMGDDRGCANPAWLQHQTAILASGLMHSCTSRFRFAFFSGDLFSTILPFLDSQDLLKLNAAYGGTTVVTAVNGSEMGTLRKLERFTRHVQGFIQRGEDMPYQAVVAHAHFLANAGGRQDRPGRVFGILRRHGVNGVIIGSAVSFCERNYAIREGTPPYHFYNALPFEWRPAEDNWFGDFSDPRCLSGEVSLSPLGNAILGEDIYCSDFLYEATSFFQGGVPDDHLLVSYRTSELEDRHAEEGSPIMCRIHDAANSGHGSLSLVGTDFMNNLGMIVYRLCYPREFLAKFCRENNVNVTNDGHPVEIQTHRPTFLWG